MTQGEATPVLNTRSNLAAKQPINLGCFVTKFVPRNDNKKRHTQNSLKNKSPSGELRSGLGIRPSCTSLRHRDSLEIPHGLEVQDGGFGDLRAVALFFRLF